MACEAAPIARRLELDVKTVRRAISQPPPPPVWVSSPRRSRLDPWRERITQWLREEPKVIPKRSAGCCRGFPRARCGAMSRDCGRPWRRRTLSCIAPCEPRRPWRSTSARS